jgi:hypothetical protein
MNAYGDGFTEPDIGYNVGDTADTAIIWICDLTPRSLERVRRNCRVVGVSTNPADLRKGTSKDAVAIVVPASHRFQL